MATNDELRELCEKLNLTHLAKLKDFNLNIYDPKEYLKAILEYELNQRYKPKKYSEVSYYQVQKVGKDVINKLKIIAENMSRYKKIDTDLRARALITEINGKIKQINLCLELYARDDMKIAYINHDFTEFANNISSYIPKYQKVYENIKKFENITEYY